MLAFAIVDVIVSVVAAANCGSDVPAAATADAGGVGVKGVNGERVVARVRDAGDAVVMTAGGDRIERFVAFSLYNLK